MTGSPPGVNLFQSTPPRGRRREVIGFTFLEAVSIHASAREATGRKFRFDFAWLVSIHASAREATVKVHASPNIDFVSIHASAREATGRAYRSMSPAMVSIHASAREATVKRLRLSGRRWFQSTPPRGRRHSA